MAGRLLIDHLPGSAEKFFCAFFRHIGSNVFIEPGFDKIKYLIFIAVDHFSVNKIIVHLNHVFE